MDSLTPLIPVLLASSIMPTRMLMTARLLLTERPVGNALAFLAGNWLWRLVLGAGALAVVDFDARAIAVRSAPVLGTLSAFAACLLAGFAIVEWRRRGVADDGRLARWTERLDGQGPAAVFGVTAAVMWLPGAQWLYVLLGVGVIGTSGLGTAAQAGVLVAFTLLQLAVVASPLLLHLRTPRSGEPLRRFERTMQSRAHDGFAAVLAALAVACGLLAWRYFVSF